MKVLHIYDKNSNLQSNSKHIFKTTEAFLSKFPKEYSDCYYHNLETLKIFKTTQVEESIISAMYRDDANIIMYLNSETLGHELFHMASNDMINKKYAFETEIGIENALIEGMTEYFRTKAYELAGPTTYDLETFCATMLEEIPDIFKPYFVPTSGSIYDLFPNQENIYSLMYSLSYYSETIDYLYANCEEEINYYALQLTIRDIIDSLINIELSFNNLTDKYDSKFLDYLNTNNVKELMHEIYPKYMEYATKQVNKKIRKRG